MQFLVFDFGAHASMASMATEFGAETVSFSTLQYTRQLQYKAELQYNTQSQYSLQFQYTTQVQQE
eukprot:237499-Rhodomonas_salina.1